MVEKAKPRGRPRSYDPAAVLDRAVEVFWANGFADTTLDDVSAAMGMGRPSIYNAFGDKEALFLRALEHFRDTTGSIPLRVFASADSVSEALEAFFGEIVEYTTADRSHLGCLVGNVAAVCALPDARKFVEANLALTEKQIAKRLAAAVRLGELPSGYSADQGARRAVNAMLALGVRARLGSSRRDLLSDAATATAVVLGIAPRTGPD